jgi:antitoxin VapB
MNAPHRTRSFKSGNSVAVRLPKGLGVGAGAEFKVERQGDRLILTPVADAAEAKRRWHDMLDELAKLPKPPRVQKRERIEFPDRPGF